MLADVSVDTFTGFVDEDFAVALGAGETLALRLAEATRTGDPLRPGGRAPFALLFRGPPAPILPQRIYSLEHPRLGACDVFMVPLQPDAAGARYEAVFT